ncbi:serine--tRNA ligase [Dolichospermum sp. ST_sed1]|nr:serine--tRNA ligase [Dolichospermum sp. ST_sed1]MDD1427000.1 serine--tRNA ligase [Dolichospermum sp. ST_sed9]MDD1434311.1 serine--tRNA ligase [Dolichospermum sp. ST_sed6]MDD1437750.1 serine--tRNA ligase [Dolichospermum sp. ST_sed10]MDD1443639.1 serine--tRNA ligase [Dolichospermum sp. ST_sed3]MDD1449273.1 serine--tRNA ligase [Dolichospermum sp. ST_sed8]MDD1457794.1 serine--tRNA ligase [Dolichospermum sp. ST_sed7]MDD1463238.1 serine--tRNA ligase [Dolichospermum sp. ST_sed2]MDD1468595.1 ser
MLDIKQIRENPQLIQEKLNTRSGKYEIQPILDLSQQQRELEVKRNELQARSNEIGKIVGQKVKSGVNPQDPEIQALKDEGNSLKITLSELEPQEKELKVQIHTLLLALPNLPSDSTPIGTSEDDNQEVKTWGDEYIPQNPNIVPHWEIGEKLGFLNFERAVKIAQTRFVSLVGAGAALERALIQFMLSTHIQAGYIEISPPLLVNTDSLTGTGQLPKFAEDSFKCAEDDLWLIPTAEVPVTNFYRGEIINTEDLPIYHTAYTPCFRREAGSYGRDMRGLIRLHQFNKVELVKLVKPESSFDELEKLLVSAESILQALKLPYRVINLCTADLGFGATKTYDLEVWLPSAGKYREISSCSNCVDFQARRADIRFKDAGKKGTQFVHTLNGSGLAVGRTMAAILENYQQPDGTIKVPEVLQVYLGREVL